MKQDRENDNNNNNNNNREESNQSNQLKQQFIAMHTKRDKVGEGGDEMQAVHF